MRMRPIGRDAIGPRQHRGGEIGHRHRVGAHMAPLVVKSYGRRWRERVPRDDRGAHAMLLLA